MLDFKFSRIVNTVKASPDGLIAIPNPAVLPDHFCGTVAYQAQVDLPQAVTARVVLPQARRAMCALQVNGTMQMCPWGPYEWEIALPQGPSTLTLEVSNTPGEAVKEPSHLKYLRDNGFDNVYFHYWEDFEPLFPGEDPLNEAILEW